MREPENFCFQNYGTQIGVPEGQAIDNNAILHDGSKTLSRAPISIGVISPETTRAKVLSCSWGLTGDEIRLASSAAYFLSTFRLPLFYAVVSNRDMGEREIREAIRTFKAELAKEQGREHRRGKLPMAPAYVEILEGSTGVHSNILFPLTEARARRWIPAMLRSPRFPETTLHIQEAKGWQWFVSYCSDERTPQAKYVGDAGALNRRKKGSHQLGEGGGDRVRPSELVEAALIERGEAFPRRRAYAKGLPKAEKERAPQACGRINLFDSDGQSNLFGALSGMHAPERPSASPRRREKIPPAPMLRLFTVIGNVDVIEAMRGLAPTHEAVAERIGISRPQTTNILNRQFRPSRAVVQRILELARAA